MTEPRLAAVVVLAAGEGTRMRSATTPKVLHPLCGRSLLGHVGRLLARSEGVAAVDDQTGHGQQPDGDHDDV